MNKPSAQGLTGKSKGYWKWQLSGWAAFAVIYTAADSIHPSFSSAPLYIIAIAMGLLFLGGVLLSHFMRRLIIYWGLMKHRLRYQLFVLFVLTVIFTLLFWLFFTVSFYVSVGAWKLLPALFSSLLHLNLMQLRALEEQLFAFSVPFMIWNLLYVLIHYDRKNREAEWKQLIKEREMMELEASALRAQMNPHFIFNCLNSIKALMQDGENEKGVTYLTTFSKLIRTLFNNADKKEVSLHDEIVTCKYYLELEAMRFGSKLSYSVDVDPELDLKSVFVPALIIQPFIENAIWHGIVPGASGGTVVLAVSRHGSQIHVTIEDDGIGRAASMANQAMTGIGHQSKGINLTQSRLELDSILKKRKADLQFTDKLDHSGKPAGTKVVISFSAEE